MKAEPLSGVDIGNEFYNEARFHDFDCAFAMSLATMVDLCRGEDEEFMCDFWDSLRNHAWDDDEFAKMLMKSKVMEHADIYGITENVSEDDFADELDEDSENF